MVVYIEYAILDNVIINYLLLSVTNKICNLNVNFKKIFFSSVVATIFSILKPLVTLNNILAILLKLIMGCVIICILYKFKKFKHFLCVYLIFLSVTFLFGGFVIGILSIFNIKYTQSGLIFLNFENHLFFQIMMN